MTTNVYDKKVGVLSSDSRWSTDNGEWIAYVDNTGYDKIAFNGRVGFLFAGDLPPIDEWKTYVANGMKKDTRPQVNTTGLLGTRIQVIQVDMQSGDIVFQSHQFLNVAVGLSIKAIFGGTGASFARECWRQNRCAKKAIVSAAIDDMRSGGEVVHLTRSKTGETNVKNSATARSVNDQLKEKGFIMHTTKKQPVLLKDAANDLTSPAQSFAKAVMSGAAPLTAPFIGMDEPWTKEKLAEFDAALSKYEN
jgi:hypothetical protein